MALLFDSALTAALGTELQREWAGQRLEAVFFDGESRRVRLLFHETTWGWFLHPRHGVLLRIPAPAIGRRRPDRGILAGRRVVKRVEVEPDARRLCLHLVTESDDDETLVFELVTNRWNAVYVAGRVHAVLHKRPGASEPRPGAEWNPTASPRRWADSMPDPAEWGSLFDSGLPPEPDVRRQIAYLSSINEAAVFPPNLGADPAASYRLYARLRSDIFSDPPAGWLIPTRAGCQPYPSSLDQADAELAGTLLEAFAGSVAKDRELRDAVEAASEDPEVAALKGALGSRRDRAARKLRALEEQFAAGAEAPALRELGHILLARKGSVPSGVAEVRLDDFAGEPITIRLEPMLDAVGNAEAYYERARRLDRAVRDLPAKIDAARKTLTRFSDALEDLQDRGPNPGLRTLAGLRAPPGGTASAGVSAEGDRLPYRIFRTTGGLEVRAGRSASDNDALTFRHSSPEDIWMHVREAPGSHVVLRWSRRDQNPPLRDITEAAVIAAAMSQARGSGLVPVSWTRRKYVRKPRKARPGTVTTERTQTMFVEPDTRLVNRLAVDRDAPPLPG